MSVFVPAGDVPPDLSAPDLSPAALLARVQAIGGDWRRPGLVPRLAQAEAMARLHLLPDALAALEPETGVAAQLLRIDLLLRLCRVEAAEAALKALPPAGLPHADRRRRARLDIDLTEQLRGPAQALVVAARYRQRFPQYEPLLQHYLALLAASDPTGAAFMAEAVPLLETGITLQTRLAILNHMQQFNRLGQVLPALMDHIEAPDAPPRPEALERAFHAAWLRQDAGVLTRLVDRCLTLERPLPGPVRFARERESIFPDLSRLIAAAAEWLDRQSFPDMPEAEDYTTIAPAARLAALVGHGARGIGWLRPLVVRHPFLVRERLVLAELLVQEGEIAAAEAELDIVLAEAPHLSRGYQLRYEILSHRPGSEEETARLLEARRSFVRGLRPAAGPGALPPYDLESFELEMRRGAVGPALLHRSGRPACHYLAASLKRAYPGLRRPVLKPGGHRRRIGLLAWEGIADEVRMAQVYGLLEGRADEVIATCEPRLESLLARSFPFIRFRPLRRRWTLLWQDRPILREEIPERILSGYLDAATQDEMQGCDLVFFPEEIMGQMALFQPLRWRQHLKRLRRGYLRPDPLRRAHWAARLRGASAQPVVGLLWRSAVQSHSRNPHYLSLEEILGLVHRHPGVTWVSLQPRLSAEEQALCAAHGILIPEGLDLFEDMEGIAGCAAALDLVVGISSLPFELAAAVGVPVWMLALTPVGQHKRQTVEGRDQMTVNGRVFGPRDPALFPDRAALLADLFDQIGAELAGSGRLDPRPSIR